MDDWNEFDDRDKAILLDIRAVISGQNPFPKGQAVSGSGLAFLDAVVTGHRAWAPIVANWNEGQGDHEDSIGGVLHVALTLFRSSEFKNYGVFRAALKLIFGDAIIPYARPIYLFVLAHPSTITEHIDEADAIMEVCARDNTEHR